MSDGPVEPGAAEGGPLRILVLNWLDRENPRSGGAEIHLHETFGRLAGWGHSVVGLVSGWPGAPPRVDLDGIELHRTGGRHTFLLEAGRYYRAHLRDRPFDVVVEDLNKVPLFTPLWDGPPPILLVHHLFGASAFQAAPVPVAALTWLLERPIPRVYQGVPAIAVSESTKEDLVRRGMESAAVTVVRNGIDVERFQPHPEVTREARPTLVFVGRLTRYKRVDLVLQALARMRATGRDVVFHVAGTGPARAELEARAGELGLEDLVHFHGFVSEERKVELYRRSWVHVLTSVKEGWGISNIEAAGCGTPTVASDAPGVRESVVPGETGLLVPHGDVPALATAIADLLDDPERLRTLSEGARAYARGFSWDATARGVERVLRRVVAGSEAG